MKNENKPLEDLNQVPDEKSVDDEVQSFEEKLVEEPKKPELHILVAQDDAYIADRINAQPKDLNKVLQMKERKYAPGEHRLSLPEELREFEDRLAFRWINKKKRAMDDAIDLKGWLFVNRSTFPKLPSRLFSNSGAIERGDTILMYMPLKRAEAIRRVPGEKSSALIKAQLAKGEGKLPKGQSGFYKPKEGVPEDDDIGNDTIVEGRHF